MLQATMIIMLAIGLNDHVILTKELLNAAKRDAWLAVFLSAVAATGIIFFIYYVIHKSKQQHIGIWLRKQMPPFVANGVFALFSAALFMVAVTTIRTSAFWAKVSFLPNTPLIVLILALALVSLYSAISGMASISIVSGLLLPLVVLFGYFVGISNLSKKDFSLLFPLFEHGFLPVGEGMFYSLTGFMELVFLLGFQHYVKTKIRYWMLAVNVFILLWLTLAPLYGAITEFGPYEAANLRYPPFEEWRLLTLAFHIEHLDYFAIFQWVSGALIRISLSLFLIVEIFGIQKSRNRKWTLIVLFASASMLAEIPISDMEYGFIVEKIITPAIFFSLSAVLITFVIAAAYSKRRKMQTQ